MISLTAAEIPQARAAADTVLALVMLLADPKAAQEKLRELAHYLDALAAENTLLAKQAAELQDVKTAFERYKFDRSGELELAEAKFKAESQVRQKNLDELEKTLDEQRRELLQLDERVRTDHATHVKAVEDHERYVTEVRLTTRRLEIQASDLASRESDLAMKEADYAARMAKLKELAG